MPKKTNKKIGLFFGTDTREVSIVDRAANLRRFAASKSENEMPKNILDSVLNVEAENEGNLVGALKSKGVSEKGIEAIKSMFRLATGFKDELDASAIGEAFKSAGLEIAPQPEGQNQGADDGEGVDGEGVGDTDLGDVPESVQRALDLHKEVILKERRRNDELQEALKAERNIRLKKEYTEKARDNFGLLGAHDEVGGLLKELNDVNKSLAEKVEAVFKSAQEKIEKGALFEESGHGNEGGSGSAWQRIESEAAKLVSNKEFKTQAQAIDHVIQTNKSLYNEYLEEQGGR